MKKLKADYRKIRDKCNTMGECQYPEWEFYDAMDAILGHQPTTQPPVVVSNMAGAVAELVTMAATVQLPVGIVSAGDITTINNSSFGEPADMHTASCEPHLDGTQSTYKPQQASGCHTTPTKKRKKLKGEDMIVLMQKMLKVQEESDRCLVEMDERRLEYEELQLERDLQQKGEFQLQLLQLIKHQRCGCLGANVWVCCKHASSRCMKQKHPGNMQTADP